MQRGLSQEQLCRLYNEKYNRKYTTAAMSLIEHDKRSPELGALLDFADFYGVSLDYLLGRDQGEFDSAQVPATINQMLRNNSSLRLRVDGITGSSISYFVM